MKLAVVVVFDDPGLLSPCPFNDGQTSIQRKRPTRRELVRGGQKHGSGGLACMQPLDLHTFAVHRNWDACETGCIERLACAVIDRILDKDALSGIEQHVGAQGQCLLRAGEDEHAIGSGASATFETDVVSNGAAEQLHALGRAVQQCLRAVLPEYLSLQPLPGLQREVSGFRESVRKGTRCQKVAYATARQHRVSTLAQTRMWLPLCRPNHEATTGKTLHVFRHKAAASHTSIDESFGVQLAVGRLHCVAGHTQ